MTHTISGSFPRGDFPMVSVKNPAWCVECEQLGAESVAFGVADVSTAEEIHLVAKFAVAHQLVVSWENQMFILRPRTE